MQRLQRNGERAEMTCGCARRRKIVKQWLRDREGASMTWLDAGLVVGFIVAIAAVVAAAALGAF
jgi:hypothetical protein